ncbi:MAG: carboxymuconolactone decarboxylase family protein [Acidobacteria bacterium]|nr:carboxymuconolactone decarboxylase family protein [Acidobacteriota bacterium]
MNKIEVLALEQAPEGSRELLTQVKGKFGFVPNFFGILAHAPAALNAYMSLSNLFSGSSLSPVEQQVVLLTVSFENDCHYCMAAHSTGARMAGISAEVLSALQSGAPLPEAKLEALHEFTRKMVQSRGWIGDSDLRSFTSAGYGEQQVLEVILGIAMKTLSNYTNHIANPPLDRAFQSQEWRKSARPADGNDMRAPSPL